MISVDSGTTALADGDCPPKPTNKITEALRITMDLNILWDILLGLVAGVLAKMALPGDKFEPKGCVTTALLGMFGGFLGGIVLNLLNVYKGNLLIHLLAAFIGSVIIILVGRLAMGGGNRNPAA